MSRKNRWLFVVPLIPLLWFGGQSALASTLSIQPHRLPNACLVNIIQATDPLYFNPLPVQTKNVGQEIRLQVNVTGAPNPTITWQVEGDVIDNYTELHSDLWSVEDHGEIGTNPPIASFTGPAITFYWREKNLALPLTRAVTVTVQTLGLDCQDSASFTIERNTALANEDRQPEDFYTHNHNQRVLPNHKNWHEDYGCHHTTDDENKPWAGKPDCHMGILGAEFFDFHFRFIANYKAWRAEFGYPPTVNLYDPTTIIPASEAGYSLADSTRTTDNPNTNLPSWWTTTYSLTTLARPPWLTLTGNGVTARPANLDTEGCLPQGGQQKLGDFTSLEQVGCVVGPWHAAVHSAIDGDMGTAINPPRDPVFWRWHSMVDVVAQEWRTARGQMAGVAPALAITVPPQSFKVDGVPYVRVIFDQAVTGVTAGALLVNSTAATQVQMVQDGGIDYAYIFTGFPQPGLGDVAVTLDGSKIQDSEALKLPNATWHYQVITCEDADADGEYAGQCWPRPSFDNCPSVANADQMDMNHNGIGDVCETDLFLPLVVMSSQ